MIRNLTRAIGDLDPDLSLTFSPLSEQVRAALVHERLTAVLSAFFGGLALLLAGLGLHSVTAYAVQRRRGEMGIRMALGASPDGVVRLVLGRVALLVGTGAAISAVASWWMAPLVRTLLYSLEPRDPITVAAATMVLAAAGALAAFVPARRASRIDPVETLRES